MRVTVTNYELDGKYVGIWGKIVCYINNLSPNTMWYFLVKNNYFLFHKFTCFDDKTVTGSNNNKVFA